MIVYRARNKVNGKIYVGQTILSLSRRIMFHERAKTGIFPAALRKYGREAFEFEVIDRAESQPELKEKEIFWIKHYACKVPNGYNITDGGNGGMLGYKASDETRRKMSESGKGKNTGVRNGMFGKPSPRRGIPSSREAIRKNSEAKKKQWQDPEYRQKVMNARKNPSYKRAHEGLGKKRWADPDYRRRNTESHRLYWAKKKEGSH